MANNANNSAVVVNAVVNANAERTAAERNNARTGVKHFRAVGKEMQYACNMFNAVFFGFELDGVSYKGHIDDVITLKQGTLTAREWLKFTPLDLDKMPNGLSPKVLEKVWKKEWVRTEGTGRKKVKTLCAYKAVTATYLDESGETPVAKNVYEWDEKHNKHVPVKTDVLMPIEKWSYDMLLQYLVDIWNYCKKENDARKKQQHNDAIEKFYVTASTTATIQNINSEMKEVERADVKFF